MTLVSHLPGPGGRPPPPRPAGTRVDSSRDGRRRGPCEGPVSEAPPPGRLLVSPQGGRGLGLECAVGGRVVHGRVGDDDGPGPRLTLVVKINPRAKGREERGKTRDDKSCFVLFVRFLCFWSLWFCGLFVFLFFGRKGTQTDTYARRSMTPRPPSRPRRPTSTSDTARESGAKARDAGAPSPSSSRRGPGPR